MTDLLGLADRVVVVAGAGGGGIGTEACRLLAAAGARVAALEVDPAKLEPTLVALEGTRGPHLPLICDVRRSEQVEEAVQRAGAELGPLHGLVQVAGGMQSPDRWQPTATVDLEVVRDIHQLNFEAALVCTQAVGRRLLAQGGGGSVVLVASLTALAAAPYSAAYGAAKAALVSLVRTVAVEWGPAGIRANAVAPGTIRTPRTLRSGGTAADDPTERAAIPLGRRGRPEEVAGAAVYLQSDLATFVSGQVLAVDGASSVKPSYLDPSGLPVFVRNPELRTRVAEAQRALGIGEP